MIQILNGWIGKFYFNIDSSFILHVWKNKRHLFSYSCLSRYASERQPWINTWSIVLWVPLHNHIIGLGKIIFQLLIQTPKKV